MQATTVRGPTFRENSLKRLSVVTWVKHYTDYLLATYSQGSPLRVVSTSRASELAARSRHSRNLPSLLARRLLRWARSGDHIFLGALDDVDQFLLLGRGHLELRQARTEIEH
jgi:hypothetical protein